MGGLKWAKGGFKMGGSEVVAGDLDGHRLKSIRVKKLYCVSTIFFLYCE